VLRAVTVLTAMFLCLRLASKVVEAEDQSQRTFPAWLDDVQTANMNALTPKEAVELHISLNGIWGGIGGNDPILTHPLFVPSISREFGTDRKAFVDASHAAGLVAVAAIPTLEGMFTIREHTPNLEEMACRDANGNLAMWSSPEERCLQMCANNPDWLKWEIEFGKQGIDAGADIVQVDTPQGQAVGYIIRKGGFCSKCMDTFKKHLYAKYSSTELKEKFAITEFKEKEIVERLKDPPPGDQHAWLYANRIKQNPLFHEFLIYQEKAGYETRKVLIETLREYARSKGRKVMFACNAFQLGAANPFGYWIRGIMFADVFDLFIYENGYSPHGIPLEDVKPPRAKWAPVHKLSYPIHHHRATTVMGAGAMPRLFKAFLRKEPNPTTWMAVQCAEAYAANASYSTYYFTPASPEYPDGFMGFRDAFWQKAFDLFEFILAHKDLYSGSLRSGSPAAFLFLYNDRGRMIPGVYPSYSGLAQAFIEGNYPFDVLFAGDDGYVKDRLRPESLQGYRTLIVPSPIAPTKNQQTIVKEFVRSGGTVVCQEPARLGFEVPRTLKSEIPYLAGSFTCGKGSVTVLKGDVTETWTNDIGSNFFRDYRPELRTQICDLAERIGLSPVLEREPDGLICAFPTLQPSKNRVVVHVVNYDVDYDTDAVREKIGITVRIPRPPFLKGEVICELYALGLPQPARLNVTASDNTVSCTIPRLSIAATVVFSKG